MQAFRGAGEADIEILPVVVVVRTFPARPSSVPEIRDFVRRQLAQVPLPEADMRTLDQRVADVLLETAGSGSTIQVSLRIFTNDAEVDVLQAGPLDASGTTGTISTQPSAAASPSAAAVPSPTVASPAVAPPGDGRPDGRDRAPVRPHVSFAEWLAESLRREGLTMEATARRLKVSVKTVSRWVGGTTEPRLRDLSRIRELFGELPFP